MAVDVGLIFLAAELVRLAALWSGLSDPVADQLIGAAVGSAVWFAALVSLAAPSRPTRTADAGCSG